MELEGMNLIIKINFCLEKFRTLNWVNNFFEDLGHKVVQQNGLNQLLEHSTKIAETQTCAAEVKGQNKLTSNFKEFTEIHLTTYGVCLSSKKKTWYQYIQ